jgi:hypothetical protein
MSDEIDGSGLDRYSDLMKSVETILSDLARDAARHGFDITPYLKRLAELEGFGEILSALARAPSEKVDPTSRH